MKETNPNKRYRGKVYVGSSDPLYEKNALLDTDWVEIRADDFLELKKTAERLCSGRFRQNDRMLLYVLNNKYYPSPVSITRMNTINEDNRIESSCWLPG